MKAEEFLKSLIGVAMGILATFFKQYGLLFVLVSAAVVLDFITGIIKAKATGEGLDSKVARRGFWKKMSLFAALAFGVFLDLAAESLLINVGITIEHDTPFALVVSSYIVVNECISVAENLYLINPESLPEWVIKALRVANKK